MKLNIRQEDKDFELPITKSRLHGSMIRVKSKKHLQRVLAVLRQCGFECNLHWYRGLYHLNIPTNNDEVTACSKQNSNATKDIACPACEAFIGRLKECNRYGYKVITIN